MISVDTNILVRFIVYDHKEQAQKARKLIEKNDVCIPLIVLVEMVWVLESAYGFSVQPLIQPCKSCLNAVAIAVYIRHPTFYFQQPFPRSPLLTSQIRHLYCVTTINELLHSRRYYLGIFWMQQGVRGIRPPRMETALPGPKSSR